MGKNITFGNSGEARDFGLKIQITSAVCFAVMTAITKSPENSEINTKIYQENE